MNTLETAKIKKYRLVQIKEIIKEEDEFLDDDCETWHSVKDWPIPRALIGHPYNPYFTVPFRREIKE